MSSCGNQKWEVGKWYKIMGELQLCENGFHCSRKAIDAMSYVHVEILARVEVRGKHIEKSDKECWSEMKIVKAWKWTKRDSVALAVFSAELVLESFEKDFPSDKNPRKAIEAAKKYLDNPSALTAPEITECARLASMSASYTACDLYKIHKFCPAVAAAYAAHWAAATVCSPTDLEAALAVTYTVSWVTTIETVHCGDYFYPTLKNIKGKIEKWILNRTKNLEKC